MMHGPIPVEQSLDDVVRDIKAFLVKYPTEFVIASVKSDRGDDDENYGLFEEFVRADIKKSKTDVWGFFDKPPTYQQAKGKIIVLNRFRRQIKKTNSSGTNAFYLDFGDNEKLRERPGYALSDYYKVSDEQEKFSVTRDFLCDEERKVTKRNILATPDVGQ